MAVAAHAENRHVEGSHPGSLRVAGQRDECCRGGLVLDQMLAHQPRVGALAGFRHLALIDEGDADAGPCNVHGGEFFEEQLRKNLDPAIQVEKLDLHANSKEFGVAVAQQFLSMINK